MKLVLALVAAMSLAACVDEPTDPAESLSGIGPSKSFTTDPTLLVPKDFEQSATFNGEDVTNLDAMMELAIEEIDYTECKGLECAALGLRMNGTEILFYDVNGKYLGLGHTPRK